jgi:1,2-diacylglycerol 3-alpha-glucosyltransferase
MKILHLCLANFYFDNFSYQENMLPYYHSLNNHEVMIIASTIKINKEGKQYSTNKSEEYFNEFNIKVKRLSFKFPFLIFKKIKAYNGLYQSITSFNPDIIFIHGLQFLDLLIINKVKKYFPKVKIYIDNHADYNNSAKNFLSMFFLHNILWKNLVKLVDKNITHYFGVTPIRKIFLEKVYSISNNKTSYLPLGLNDKLLSSIKIQNSDNLKFRIITGGKFTKDKKAIFTLIKSFIEFSQKNNSNFELYIFGTFSFDFYKIFNALIKNQKNIYYLGFLDQLSIYENILQSDIAIFTGNHSVLWEESVALGIPIVIINKEEYKYLNINNNIVFLNDFKIQTFDEIFLNLLVKPFSKLDIVKKNAKLSTKDNFYYSNISKKSIL